MRAVVGDKKVSGNFEYLLGLKDAVSIWSAGIVPLLISDTYVSGHWEEVTSCGKLFILTSRSKTHIPTDRMEK